MATRNGWKQNAEGFVESDAFVEGGRVKIRRTPNTNSNRTPRDSNSAGGIQQSARIQRRFQGFSLTEIKLMILWAGSSLKTLERDVCSLQYSR